MINPRVFYNLDYVADDTTLNDNVCSFVTSLSSQALNDNQIIRIIFDVAGETGCYQNDLSAYERIDMPAEVSSVLAALHREFPDMGCFKDDKSAFEFIQSRYCQFGGELDEYGKYLASVLREEINNSDSAPGSNELT